QAEDGIRDYKVTGVQRVLFRSQIIEPTDALIRVTRACVCGSDLWPYQKMERSVSGRVMGHEAIGVVEDVGADVRTIKRGDFVIKIGRASCRERVEIKVVRGSCK